MIDAFSLNVDSHSILNVIFQVQLKIVARKIIDLPEETIMRHFLLSLS